MYKTTKQTLLLAAVCIACIGAVMAVYAISTATEPLIRATSTPTKVGSRVLVKATKHEGTIVGWNTFSFERVYKVRLYSEARNTYYVAPFVVRELAPVEK